MKIYQFSGGKLKFAGERERKRESEERPAKNSVTVGAGCIETTYYFVEGQVVKKTRNTAIA